LCQLLLLAELLPLQAGIVITRLQVAERLQLPIWEPDLLPIFWWLLVVVVPVMVVMLTAAAVLVDTVQSQVFLCL
jgi:hypothetical protein